MRLCPIVRAWIAAFVLIQPSASAWAQAPVPPGAAAFFDDSQLHTIALTVNPRDWSQLKTNFQLNT